MAPNNKNNSKKIKKKKTASLSPEVMGTLQGESKPDAIRHIRTESTTYCGPLPPPSALEHYNKIHPGAADRIIAMAEKQASHRRELETKIVTGGIAIEGRASTYGFVLGVLGLLVGLGFAYLDHPYSGAAIGGVSLVGLVSVFVIGSITGQKKDEVEDENDE